MHAIITKHTRMLFLFDEKQLLLSCPVALGFSPIGHKQQEGDGKTPEGLYTICLIKEHGKYGKSLGLSYPNPSDALAAFHDQRIDAGTYNAIVDAHASQQRPAWGSPLGGEIYLHEGNTNTDWTAGCIALDPSDMALLFEHRDAIKWIVVTP